MEPEFNRKSRKYRKQYIAALTELHKDVKNDKTTGANGSAGAGKIMQLADPEKDQVLRDTQWWKNVTLAGRKI